MPSVNRLKAMMVISYDDAPFKDYTLAFPVHRKYDIPAEISVVSDYIGTPGFLSHDKLLEMQQANFEIISHTKSHKMLCGDHLIRPARRGATKIYLQKVRFDNALCLIREGERQEIIRVIRKEKDREGHYAVIEPGLQWDYSTEAEIRLTEEELVKEIKTSKERLWDLGLRVTGFTYPFNRYDESAKRIVSRFYQSARASGNDGINEIGCMDRYSLNAKNFLYLREQQIADILDRTASEKSLCIFYCHTWESRFTESRLKFLIRQARSRNIEIVTRRQAFQIIEGGTA